MSPFDWRRYSSDQDSDTRLHLGYANADRAFGQPVYLSEIDRFAHLYILGRTGTGKSHLLSTLMEQDLRHGRGFMLLDPHGDLVSELEAIDELDRARIFDASADGFHLNPFASSEGISDGLTVATILSVFARLWEDSWGPRLEHLLRNVLFTMVANPNTTLGDIPRLLTDKDYRRSLTRGLSDRAVRSFWYDEYAGYSPAFRAVIIAPLQNKLGALLTDPRMRAILDTHETSVDFDEMLARGDAVAISLSKGILGEGASNLLGGLISARLTLAGLARARLQPSERRPFFAYLDEFPAFSTSMLATGLSELRKYRVGLILAHQYLAQLTPFIRDAALGNVGTLMCFRLGAADAAFVAREFSPTFEPEDLLNLPNYNVYAKLLTGGQVTRAFSMCTYDRLPRNLGGR